MTAIINWSNVTDLSQVPSQANVAMDGGFWVGMLFMLWIIMIILSHNFGLEASLLMSSFLAFILGMLLSYADLMAWQWNLVFVAVIFFMFLYITYNKKT